MKILSNEIVFRGHPDKLADQISDKILMEYIILDQNSKINIDVVGGEGTVFVTGQICSNAKVDIKKVVKEVLDDVGCNSNLIIVNNIENGESREVDKCYNTQHIKDLDENAVFGYACNETPQKLPKSVIILQEFAKAYDLLCKKDKRFLPDGKVQGTGIYDNNKRLIKLKSINVDYQNTGENTLSTDALLNTLLSNIAESHGIEIEELSFNPRGEYKVGGFDRDTGLTGCKTIMGSYQGFAPVGAGAYSGKDPKCINRGATHKARDIAKSMLDIHDIDWCEVQLIYDDNFSKLIDIVVNSSIGELEVESTLYEECLIDNVVRDLNLISQDYFNMSAFGHFQN